MTIDNLLTQISFCTVEEKVRILNTLFSDPVLKPVVDQMFKEYTKQIKELIKRIKEVENAIGGKR